MNMQIDSVTLGKCHPDGHSIIRESARLPKLVKRVPKKTVKIAVKENCFAAGRFLKKGTIAEVNDVEADDICHAGKATLVP